MTKKEKFKQVAVKIHCAILREITMGGGEITEEIGYRRGGK